MINGFSVIVKREKELPLVSEHWGNEHFNDYTVEMIVGEGTYGQVYKAKNKKTRKFKALG